MREWILVALTGGLAVAGCDQFKAATDRAMLSLSQIGVSCPEPVEGRSVGTETADGAFGCFGKAVTMGRSDLLNRVVCAGKTTASCRQTPETTAEVEKSLRQLSKLSWTTGVLGSWNDGEGVTVYAVDNQGNDKRVSAVTICRIAEGDRWAVCDVGEVPREVATRKGKKDEKVADTCPPAADGRAAGTDSPEATLGCFQRAIDEKKSELLLRVTCHGKTVGSCKHTDATTKQAESAVADLAKVPWNAVIGRWSDGDKTFVYAVDNQGGGSTVSAIAICKIADGGKWAICDVGSVPRETAKKKLKN